MADVAEMDHVDAVEFHDEGDVAAALRALVLIPESPYAGDQDVLDLVFAGTIKDEGILEAARQQRAAVARESPLGLGVRRVVGVTVGDDLAGDAPTRGADDRLIGVPDHNRIFAPHADASPPIPDDLHGVILAQVAHGPLTGRRDLTRLDPARVLAPQKEDRRRLPNRHLRSEGGRMELQEGLPG